MVQVCEGTKTKQDMLAQSIEQYKDMYIRARGEFNKVITVSSTFGRIDVMMY
jgi:DNA topoisomerase-3